MKDTTIKDLVIYGRKKVVKSNGHGLQWQYQTNLGPLFHSTICEAVGIHPSTFRQRIGWWGVTDPRVLQTKIINSGRPTDEYLALGTQPRG